MQIINREIIYDEPLNLVLVVANRSSIYMWALLPIVILHLVVINLFM